MGKDRIEQLLQLVREKTVEEEVRNDQVVGSGGVPFATHRRDAGECAGGLGPDLRRRRSRSVSMEWLESTTSAVRVGLAASRRARKRPSPSPNSKGVAGAGEMGELGTPAAGEPWPKTDVLEPAIGAGNAIEVGSLGSSSPGKGNRANGVSRAASAAMRRCRGERWELRASRAKSSPLLTSGRQINRRQARGRRKQGRGQRKQSSHGYDRPQVQAGPAGRRVEGAALPFLDADAIDPAEQGKEDDGGRQLLFP